MLPDCPELAGQSQTPPRLVEGGNTMAAVGSIRTARLGAWSAILLLAALPGCATIRVDRTHRSGLFAAWSASAVRSDELSPRTLQTLRQWDLADLYARSPDEAIGKLRDEVIAHHQPELVFALAEIHYVRGRKAEKHDCAHATADYYLCAGYAYHYLFDQAPRLAPDTQKPDKETRGQGDKEKQPSVSVSPCLPVSLTSDLVSRSPEVRWSIFDPRFRLACDLYNAGLAKCIAAAQRVGQLDPRNELRMPTPDGKGFTLSVVHTGFTWKPEEFGKLLICGDYEVVGLANQHRTYGLGVPLIATRAADADKEGASGAFYPRDASFAATAFFRFEGTLADLGTQRCGRLELYNPLTTRAVAAAGQVVPLETDLTTPLAYFLAHSNLGNLAEISGFVYSDHIRGQSGIRMLAPYQPGKIPVVLVHGLLSSPLTWAPVINDLQADPVLRERFQFWYYYYPTGAPYLASAAELRRELNQLRDEVDPRRQDPALDNMVFVGHSMGGLISKLMTLQSGDDFWHLVSNEPLDQLKMPESARAELRQMFYFPRERCVTRCIFIGTPHHGSKLSPSPLGRLAVHLIHLPQDLMTASQDLLKDNPDLPAPLHAHPLPTSVDLLAPQAPALELMAARPRPERVHYHSIIGVISTATTDIEKWIAGDLRDPGDGVVPYKSAHIDDKTVSEKVVPADHFHVHHHPLAIQEVRRILLEHYQGFVQNKDARKELQLMSSGAQPAD
jgi:pimeloyl-ACP methyl ester carboxylesterase